MTRQLHKEAITLLDELDDLIKQLDADISYIERRRIVNKISSYWFESSLPDVETVDTSIVGCDGEVPIRIYHSSTRQSPIFVFFHGGGFFCCGIDTHEPICRYINHLTDWTVISVGYRLAPEHPFPAGLEDAYSVYIWAREYGSTIGGDDSVVTVGGDSAGGNLAASLCLLTQQRQTDRPDHQVLMYPVVEYPKRNPSFSSDGPLTSDASANHMWSYYLRSDIDGWNPYVSPIDAPSLDCLPPTSLITCEFDTHTDGAIKYLDRIADCGIDTSHHHFDDMFHPFLNFPQLERTQEAYERISNELHGVNA